MTDTERRDNGGDGRRGGDTPGAIARSDAFDAELEKLDVPAVLHDLQIGARRASWRDLALALSIVLDVVLSIIVWRIALSARDTAHVASQAAAAARSANEQAVLLCRAGNESRAQQVQLWQFVIQLSSTNNTQQARTPDEEQRQRDQRATFERYLQTVFAQRDCSHVTIAEQPPTTSTSSSTPTTRPTTSSTARNPR